MVKYLKVTISGTPYLIPATNILGVEVGADTKIKILSDIRGYEATGASEVLGYEITATGASDATKTVEQLNAFVGELEQALQTSWTNPFYNLDGKLPYAPTAVEQIEVEWSA